MQRFGMYLSGPARYRSVLRALPIMCLQRLFNARANFEQRPMLKSPRIVNDELKYMLIVVPLVNVSVTSTRCCSLRAS